MSASYLVLAARIRQELDDLTRIVERIYRAQDAIARSDEGHDLFVNAIALNLHDFYCCLERVFEQVARQVDSSIPEGHDWHRSLLRQMAVAVSELRPQVLSLESVRLLDEFLRFRHLVRHSYAFDLDEPRVVALVDGLSLCFERVYKELLAFSEFIQQL